MRVLVLGATGQVGRHVTAALLARGDEVTCVVRPSSRGSATDRLAGATLRWGDVTEPGFWARGTGELEGFDAVISALASRTGTPADARRVDREAHLALLDAARRARPHVILVSAICVQKPALAFQFAKLEVERALVASGLRYTIVRPTAFFQSLSGQLARVKRGEPYVVLGDGRLTACKPMGMRDLADFLVGCLDQPDRWDRTLPIGGPGPALTPLEQGEILFEMCGRRPRFRRVPVAVLDAVLQGLVVAGRVWPAARDKAELARIGRYYGTESMLVWDETTRRYDATGTPSWGHETLRDHVRALLRGEQLDERGAHAVF